MLITPHAIGRRRPRLRPAERPHEAPGEPGREPWEAGLALKPEEYALIRAYVANSTPRAPVAWLLWVFTGLGGGHRFYLGPRWLGALMLAVNGAMLVVTGGLWLLPAVMWWLGDGWLVPERLDAARRAAGSRAALSMLDARKQGGSEAATEAAADAATDAATDAGPGDGVVYRIPSLPDAPQSPPAGATEDERAAG